MKRHGTGSRRAAALAALAAGLLSAVLGARPVAAQNVLDVTIPLRFDRPEAWAMKWAGSLSLFTGLGVPGPTHRGELQLGLEVGTVPALSESERRVGFNGTKVEDINRLDAFTRPRLRAGLSRRLAIAASVVPPVTIEGIEPEIYGLALDALLFEGERWRVGGRLFGSRGTIDGDITCPASEVAAGDDLRRNPFRCEERSHDRITVEAAGAAVAVALERGREGRLEPYAGVGLAHMDLELQVDARYSGIIDRALYVTDGWTAHATVGLGYRLSRRLSVAGELFYSPLDVVRPPKSSPQNDPLVNLRAVLRYAVR